MATVSARLPASAAATNEKVDDMTEAKERYILANDNAEIVRMTHQHEWMKGSAGGLVRAPINLSQRGLKVLDSATADGIWLFDIRSSTSPDAKLVGFDIAPELFPSPESTPANVEITLQDLFKPLPAEWQGAFDLVHQRFILPSFQEADVEATLRQLVSAVKPGGWLQLVEPNATARVSDPEAKSFEMLYRISETVMPNPNPTPKAIAYLKELGMVDIRHETFDMAIGKGNSDGKVGEHGRQNFCAVISRYMEGCKPEAFGMTAQQWRDLPANLAADTQNFSCAMRMNFICARKAT